MGDYAMSDSKKFTKKQLAVLDELFAGELTEDDICKKHSVTKAQYHKWLSDERFCAEFARRIDWLNLQSQALIARYASLAAAKLVELIDSDKEETRRKACLDIISLPRVTNAKQAVSDKSPDKNRAELPPEVASRLLTALAEG
jgi:hypothetical protein